MRVAREDRHEGLPVEQDLLVREDHAATVREVLLVRRQIGRSEDRLYSGVLASRTRVNRFDPRVGIRRAEHFGMQHARQLHIVGIDGLAGHLADTLQAHHPLADVAVFGLDLFFADFDLLRHIASPPTSQLSTRASRPRRFSRSRCSGRGSQRALLAPLRASATGCGRGAPSKP